MYELAFNMTLPTHIAVVNKTNLVIYCWKYTHDQSKVDFQSFYIHQQEQAIDYIITPFPTLEWNLILTD